jgi:excisionase family DNA binding protein
MSPLTTPAASDVRGEGQLSRVIQAMVRPTQRDDAIGVIASARSPRHEMRRIDGPPTADETGKSSDLPPLRLRRRHQGHRNQRRALLEPCIRLRHPRLLGTRDEGTTRRGHGNKRATAEQLRLPNNRSRTQPGCRGHRALTNVSAPLQSTQPTSGHLTVGLNDDRLLTASEVAEHLRVTPAWVYAETRRNRLPHVRLGRYVRYRRSAIDRWIERQEAG